MRWLLLIGLVGCATEPTLGGVDGDGQACSVGVEEGECAPDFELLDASGEVVRFSDYAGRPVLIFGSSLWCTTCRTVVQELQQAYASLPADAEVLNVLVENLDSEPASVADADNWKSSFMLDFPVLADSEELWVEAYGNSASRTFTQHSYTVVDSAGRVTYRRTGRSEGKAEELLAALEAAAE